MKIVNQQKLEKHLQSIIQNFFDAKTMQDLAIDKSLVQEQINAKEVYEIEILARTNQTPNMLDHEYEEAHANYESSKERQLSRWIIDGEPLIPTFVGVTDDKESSWLIWYLLNNDSAHISLDIRAKFGEPVHLQLKISEIFANKIELLDLYEEYLKSKDAMQVHQI